MKTISLNDYNSSLGILIDVRRPDDYSMGHDPRSINIYADKLIFNHDKYLSKEKTYYIICDKGHLSGKVIRALSLYGYSLIQVRK